LWHIKSGRSRKGTRWAYWARDINTGEPDPDEAYEIRKAFRQAKELFANHAGVTKSPKRIFTNPRSSLMNNGLLVGESYRIALGYNLTANPGRDRAAFDIDDPEIINEIRSIFSRYAAADELATVLREGIYSTDKLEFTFQGYDIRKAEIEKATKLVKSWRGIKYLAWGSVQGDAAMIADVQEQHEGDIKVLIFQSTPPQWVQRGVPHVSFLAKSRVQKSTKKAMAKDFSEAVWLLIHDVIRMSTTVKDIEMHTTLGSGVNASANTEMQTIRFAWKRIRHMDVQGLFAVLCHEIAHLSSDADDCTRAHTREISRIMSHASAALAVDPKARKAWKMASTRIQRFNKSKKGA